MVYLFDTDLVLFDGVSARIVGEHGAYSLFEETLPRLSDNTKGAFKKYISIRLLMLDPNAIKTRVMLLDAILDFSAVPPRLADMGCRDTASFRSAFALEVVELTIQHVITNSATFQNAQHWLQRLGQIMQGDYHKSV